MKTLSLLFRLMLAIMVPVAAAGDAAAGKQLFLQQCAACHAMEPGDDGAQGPSLAALMGRVAGADSVFTYTRALRNSKLVWDAATLDRFLEAPDTLVPGTEMIMPVPRKADRDNLIAYFQSLAKAGGDTAP